MFFMSHVMLKLAFVSLSSQEQFGWASVNRGGNLNFTRSQVLFALPPALPPLLYLGACSQDRFPWHPTEEISRKTILNVAVQERKVIISLALLKNTVKLRQGNIVKISFCQN